MLGSACRLKMHFYPRPPGGGRPISRHSRAVRGYFYPRPPGGGRPKHVIFTFVPFKFLSTPSGWRATRRVRPHLSRCRFLSTPSGWRATGAVHFHGLCNSISIHALRVEGDTNAKYTIIRKKDFYPRPPGGGRPKNIELCKKGVLFLSTPSGWRATGDDRRRRNADVDFYPRLPGGGRPVALDTTLTHEGISIHALRVEGDLWADF